MDKIIIGALIVAFSVTVAYAEQMDTGKQELTKRDHPVTAATKEKREEAVEELNELLRGEVSAVETYKQALTKLGNEPGADKLRANLKDHEDAVKVITKQITDLGGVPTKDSGTWGVWAETVVGSAKLLGDDAALKALEEGEDHGVSEYVEILEEENVPETFKTKVRSTHLPKQREHIASIKTLMEMN